MMKRAGFMGNALVAMAVALQGSPLVWAQLAEVDPVLHAGVEALVASDPEVARDPELAQLCRHIAEAVVLDPRERAAVTQEAAVLEREGIDLNTVISPEVRETARTRFNEVQARMQAEAETLRASDPDRARGIELMIREGERQMTAFERGERYTPSPEMVSHAQDMFREWESGMLAQGAAPEFVEAARHEFARWSSGDMMGTGGPRPEFGGPGPMGGPGSAGYDTGAAKELAAKLGVDPNLNLNDPSVVDRLIRDGKFNQDTLAKAMAEMGQTGTMDGRLGEMARTYFSGTEGNMGGRAYGQIDSNTASLVEAMTKSGALSDSRAREIMAAGGNVFDPNSREWQALSPEEKAAAATMSQRAAEALAYEQAGGDKSHWQSGWEGGSNYGINPATGGWEPNMGGGTTYAGGWEGGSTSAYMPEGWAHDQSGNLHYVGSEGTTYSSGWESTYSGGYTGDTWTQTSEGTWTSSTGETWTNTSDTWTSSNSTELRQDMQTSTTTAAQERYETAIHLHEGNVEHQHTIHVHADSVRHDHTATSPADTAPNSVFQ